jgi:hypothetical protein
MNVEYWRIIGWKRAKVTGSWRKLPNEELHMHTLPSIIRMIKSRGVKWSGHVARIWAKRNAYMLLTLLVAKRREARKTKT